MKALGFALWTAFALVFLLTYWLMFTGGGELVPILSVVETVILMALCEVIVRIAETDVALEEASAARRCRLPWIAATVVLSSIRNLAPMTTYWPPPDALRFLIILASWATLLLTMFQFAKAASRGTSDAPGQLGAGTLFWAFLFVLFTGPFLLLRKPRPVAEA